MNIESAAQAFAGAIQTEIDELTKLKNSVLTVSKASEKVPMGISPNGTAPKVDRPKPKFSKAMRKKLSDMQKRRWAQLKKAGKTVKAATPNKKLNKSKTHKATPALSSTA